MAATREPTGGAVGGISFELDRFEHVDGERLEVTGRWLGVRGRRFVRPTLTVVSESGRSRVLADLEHKPWDPDENEPWVAAFPFEKDAEVSEAELAVAPDIALRLPKPGEPSDGSRSIVAVPARQIRRRRAKDGAGAKGREELARLRQEVETLREQADGLRTESGASEEHVAGLREELAGSEQARTEAERELERTRAEAEGAIARRDAAIGKLEEVSAERDDALRRLEEVVRQRDRLERERETLAAERDAVTRERDEALAERKRAASERDKAISEREAAVSAHGAALVMRGAVRARTPDQETLIQRAAAITVLVVVTIALLIVLHAL